MAKNFCDKCNKIVPDSEIKNFLGNNIHIYIQTVNAYKNQFPGVIGCDLVSKTMYCGKMREPTPEEYFIYYTCST